jgi:hypothetical protein
MAYDLNFDRALNGNYYLRSAFIILQNEMFFYYYFTVHCGVVQLLSLYIFFPPLYVIYTCRLISRDRVIFSSLFHFLHINIQINAKCFTKCPPIARLLQGHTFTLVKLLLRLLIAQKMLHK